MNTKQKFNAWENYFKQYDLGTLFNDVRDVVLKKFTNLFEYDFENSDNLVPLGELQLLYEEHVYPISDIYCIVLSPENQMILYNYHCEICYTYDCDNWYYWGTKETSKIYNDILKIILKGDN